MPVGGIVLFEFDGLDFGFLGDFHVEELFVKKLNNLLVIFGSFGFFVIFVDLDIDLLDFERLDFDFLSQIGNLSLVLNLRQSENMCENIRS